MHHPLVLRTLEQPVGRRVPPRRGRRPVRIKQASAGSSADDGLRVLVDRLWPRGLSQERVAADLWLKDVAPSSALRRWYGHDTLRWDAFARRYRAELARRVDLLELLDELRYRDRVTLVFHASDTSRNNAAVLRDVLIERRFAAPRHNRS